MTQHGPNILQLLAPYTWEDRKPRLPGFPGKAAACGRLGSVVFIATEDHDGQVEISLVAFDEGKGEYEPSKPCTVRQANWFFRKLGIEPISQTRTKHTRHFIAQRGTVN